MNRLYQVWKESPLPVQAGIVGGLLLLMLIVGSGVGGFVSHIKDRRFDSREAEREQQRETLEDERNQAIGRAEAAEKREQDLKAQLTIHEVIAAASSNKATQEIERLKEDDARFTQEMRDADIDVPVCDRIKRICERAKRLYPNRPTAKECADCL